MRDQFIVEFPEPDPFLTKIRGDVHAWRFRRMKEAFPEAAITQYLGEFPAEEIYFVGPEGGRPHLSTYSERYISEMATRFDRFGTIYFFASKEDIDG